jgi:glucose/arabinose dehydrogenase
MNKTLTIFAIIIPVLIGGWFVFGNPQAWIFQPRSTQEPVATTSTTTVPSGGTTTTMTTGVLSEDLSVPWGVAFLPDGNILITERSGQLLELSSDGNLLAENDIDSVTPRGEGGLLGVALHPNFASNRWVYLYETYDSDQGTRNRVVRYRYQGDDIGNQTVIIDGIPGASYHDGGRIAFGPAGEHLYITTGDAGNSQEAQSTRTLNGKILRLNSGGSVPEDNPYGNAIYSYGHRNPQGITWGQDGRLWSTEHGRSGLRSGLDEINLIKQGGNYGWPYFEGDESCGQSDLYDPAAPASLSGDNCNVISPITHSGPDITWAPASAAIANNTLFFGGLRGQAIYTAPIQTGVELRLGEITAYFREEFGRIRTVEVGPATEFLYVTTSNTDGRGRPQENDDRLIRIDLDTFD